MNLNRIPLNRLSSAALLLILFTSLLAPRLKGQTSFPDTSEMHEQIGQLDASGEAKLANKDFQGAYADFRKAFEFSREMNRLYKDNAEYEPVYREQSYLFLERLSSVFLLSGDEAKALEMMEPAAAGYDELAGMKQTPESMSIAAEMCGRLAWLQLKNNQPVAAEKSSLRGVDLDSSIAWIKTNLAHALLLNGKTDQAMTLYAAEKNTVIGDGRTFGQASLDDFTEFEKAGITHPDVEKVRALYGQGPSEKTKEPVSPPLAPENENEKMALRVKAVESFLVMLDVGQFAESFDAADERFREGVTKEQYVANIRESRARMGTPTDRSLTKVDTNTDLTTGEKSYDFPVNSTFEKGSIVEKITIVESADGQYRVSDYSMVTPLQ